MTEVQDADDPLRQWLGGDGARVLDAVLAHAPDVVGIMDQNLIIRYVNWTAAGLTRERTVGASVFELVPPGYHETSRDVYLHVLKTGEPVRFETLYRDEHEILVWEVRVGPVRHEGKIVGLITIAADVTEQRSAYADRERFFSLSLDMLCVVSPEGRFKRLNPAFGEALGYAVVDLVGSPIIH